MKARAIPAAAVVVVVSALVGGLMGTRAGAAQSRDRSTSAISSTRGAGRDRPRLRREDRRRADGLRVVDGLLRTLDPHSSFLDPKEYTRQREQMAGRYFGMGISIVSVDGVITVTQLFEGSPAYRAGIRRNDVIARVGQPVEKDGKKQIAWEDTKGWAADDIVKRVRGPKGTTVEMSIRRPGVDKLIDLTVARDEIKITTVRTAFMIAPGTGYIRLQDFSETTDAEMGEALTKLKAAGMQRLVFDIRDNPGGPLDQAIADCEPLPQARADGRLHARPDSGFRRGLPRAGRRPAIRTCRSSCMVNRNSASASEIVSGAMQDHDRALLVGETTFGKALVQGVYPIAEDAGLALTTGRYLHAERPHDPAAVGRRVRRVPDLLAARPEGRSAARRQPVEVHRWRPQGLQRRRHRTRPLHRRAGRGIQSVPVLAAAARPGRLRRLRRAVHQGRRQRRPAAASGRRTRSRRAGR